MPRSRRPIRRALAVVGCILALPLVAGAFTLVQLIVDVSLDPGGFTSLRYQDQDGAALANTGFDLRNVGDGSITIQGSSSFESEEGFEPGEAVQEGFVILDGTLGLELSVLDEQGRRAPIRTTYRMDVRRENLGREFLRGRLLEQRVVRDAREARLRAGRMGLRDARVMRFAEGRMGREGRWIRAVRALDGGRIGFLPNQEPDGQLGHFGTAASADGDPYVWAVMDRNSRYAVGVTVDRDNDGVPNHADNCIGMVNANQTDADGDGGGDVCDVDDDGDTIADSDDNCPLTANPHQIDADVDGIGDACDLDADGDGVEDGLDACLGTGFGELVDAEGCSVADRCPCDNEWRNHGAFVRCVAHASRDLVGAGILSETEKDAIVSSSAESACGF